MNDGSMNEKITEEFADDVEERAGSAMTKEEYIESSQYVQYKKEFEGILERVGVGAFIGLIAGIITYTSGEGFFYIIAGPVIFAGVPYAWKKVPVFSIGCLTFCIKLFFAVLAGWIITPIALIEKYAMMKRSKYNLLLRRKCDERKHI